MLSFCWWNMNFHIDLFFHKRNTHHKRGQNNMPSNLHQNTPSYFFKTIFSCKQCLIWAYFSPDCLFHWWKLYFRSRTRILSRSSFLKLKNILMNLFTCSFSPSRDVHWWTGVVWITCGLLWCFYQLFRLSFWRHPFTAEFSSNPNQRHLSMLIRVFKDQDH